VWEPLRAHLTRADVVTPQLLGFGCPRPEGFGATKEEYVMLEQFWSSVGRGAAR
jgi:hypothetical protein